jgi:hypothetical protein
MTRDHRNGIVKIERVDVVAGLPPPQPPAEIPHAPDAGPLGGEYLTLLKDCLILGAVLGALAYATVAELL